MNLVGRDMDRTGAGSHSPARREFYHEYPTMTSVEEQQDRERVRHVYQASFTIGRQNRVVAVNFGSANFKRDIPM